MLLVFSEMLRYQLYECNVEQIELGQEINYIRNYIALQKSRMDERIQVSFCVAEANGSVLVPPLILITFIENAFKYVGFNETRGNKIEIHLKHYDNVLEFSVFNTKDSFIDHAQGASGLGIANARRRLELLYLGRHSLTISDQENTYTVCLTLNDL